MKKDDLTVGEDYITYRGGDNSLADAYGAERYRLLSDHMVKKSQALRGSSMTMDIDGREVVVPMAVDPRGDIPGTHLVFEEVRAKTGQPTGRIKILTPSQIKAGWAEGIAAISAAQRDRMAHNAERARVRDETVILAESAEGRIANLLPDADNHVTVSLTSGGRVTLSSQTLSDLLDLAQRATHGPV